MFLYPTISILKRLVLVAGFIVLLWGCSEPQKVERKAIPLPTDVEIANCEVGKYGGIFVLAMSQEPKTFNPLMSTDIYSSEIISKILSPLVTYDPIKEEVVPALAKSWEISPDGKSYTFHLRKGVKFSDGVPFSADDVIFTFDCIFAPKLDSKGNPVIDPTTKKPLLQNPSRYAGQYTIGGEYIKYEKLDSHTVRFTTKKVYAPFLNDIGYIEILPKHALEKDVSDGKLQQAWTTQTAIKNPQDMPSSGPFKIYSYKPGERLVLSPNPHYWRADKAGNRLPFIDYMIYKFVADVNTSTILFATGQCDASSISANDYAWVKKYAKTYSFKIYERGPDLGIFFIWFNQNPNKNSDGKYYLDPKKFAWFSNKNFRKAVMSAIDRDGLIKSVWFGRAKKLSSIISPANKKWHNPNIKVVEYNAELSRKLLLDAGFYYDATGHLHDKNKNRVSFDLLVGEGSQNSTVMATTFVENMKAIGIEVRLKFMDFGTMILKIDNSYEYDAAMMGFSGGGDPSGGKAIYRSDGFLHVWNPRQKSPQTQWEKEVDDIVDAQESEMNPVARKNLIYKMQEIFSEELPLLYLVTPMSYSGISEKWHNVSIPPIGSVIWNIDELFTEDSLDD